MLETKSQTIGDVTYHVRQLDAIRGRKVFVRLVKALGPVLGKIQEASKNKDGNAALGGALGAALGGLSEDDVDFFCETFASSTAYEQDGKNPELAKTFAIHFAGKYFELCEWLVFCFEVNFGDFFAKLGPKSGA